jgi:surfeit locus 1 family protein
MQTVRWQFVPGFWPGLVTILLLPVLVSLGLWQLDRAEQKRGLYEQFATRQSAEIVDLNRDRIIRNNKSEIIWRHIKLSGRFAAQTDILLDNQVVNHVPGYYVFTVLKLTDENEWVLVNRGWLPAGADRSIAPEISTPADEVELAAVATDVPATGILLGNENTEYLDNRFIRVQKIDIEEISKLTGLELLPFVARLEPGSDHGFVRQWIMPGSGEEKHLGYAFQWFALALTLLVIFIVVNTRRSKHDDE